MRKAIFTALTTVLCSAALAQGEFRPADFDFEEDKRRMDRLVVFPEIKGDVSVMLLCFSRVQPNGKMENTGCYLQNNYDEPFVTAVNKAASKARMNPAIIDGKAREIYLQFRVEFVAEKEDRRIHFHLNPGYEENVKAYGEDHIAGTRAFQKKEKWMQICPRRANFAVWARAYLGEDGKADSVSVVHADGIMPTAACQEAIKQTILSSKYTPAYAEGVPVPSTYVEIFGN